MNRYCFGCHNDRSKIGGFSVQGLNAENPGAAPDAWEKAVRKMRVRYMPPAGAPSPDEKTYEAVLRSLEAKLDQSAREKPNPGRTETLRRLNRTEYRNAVRDLLGLDVDVSSLLPKDDVAHGFDNITVGELSPTLLDRYIAAARKISRQAVGVPVRSPGGDVRLMAPDLTQEDHFDELSFGTRGGAALPYNFPTAGEYDIQLRLSRDRNERVEGLTEPHQVEIAIDGERVALLPLKAPQKAREHELADQHLHIRTAVPAGQHMIAASFLKKSSALAETERQPYQARFNMDRHPRIQPALYSISVAGPFGAGKPGDTPSRREIFVCSPASRSEELPCAKTILEKLATRAYRRPATAAELQTLLSLYKAGSSSDQPETAPTGQFENGIELAIRGILTNPQFLFRVERDPAGLAPGAAYRVSDVELATRLSFFLWSSIPDQQLLDAALAGRLKNSDELARQTRRMLADERSKSLVENFASQWLYLRNLAAVTPDARLFPDFDDNLRQSLRRETELFFESIVREDRNVLDIIRADYTFLNERLAKHYSIPGIYGSRFRRVTFPPGDPRGGLLGQGSILTVTSYATRTSPVLRGKWILANLLGSAPPPPPPNVPTLKEDTGAGEPMTMRERVAEHRRNPACSSCHQLLDPPGFALENYDAVGRWRTSENGVPVDASGNLPRTEPFTGPAGLRKTVLSRPEVFVGTLSEKLLMYALGRGLEAYDAPAVRQIVRDAGRKDYRFSEVVLQIVHSTPFQMRRAQ